MKDHVFRELVNDLRDISRQYHGHDSLRDRISGRLRQDVTPDEVCRKFQQPLMQKVCAMTPTDEEIINLALLNGLDYEEITPCFCAFARAMFE